MTKARSRTRQARSVAPPPTTTTSAKAENRYMRPLLRPGQRRLYDLLSALWLLCALWFWLWWLQPDHVISAPRYWVVTLGLGWLYFLQAFFIMVFRRARVPAGDPPEPGSVRVAMIVTKTPSEPFEVVRKTLEAMLAQDYPHDTWLADEDPAPETVAWCSAHGVRISSRKGEAEYHRAEWPRRTRCKEGNLARFYDRHGYDEYDFVSQLDADHVPQPSYLTEIMRGFADPAVGYVSAPSICAANAATSWAARARMHTEAAFHGIFQTGYAAALAPMCIGSHYAVRTAALRSVGGLGPDLAEDHSTTMMLNAGGWRGVHAIDAIAFGDGPATVADLCTQEFQWSRSLVTILLRHTPDHIGRLPWRLKAQFLFCQMLYPIFATFMLAMYFVPVAAVLFDIRYADVTFPAFLVHSAPTAIAMLMIAYAVRRDGFFRPVAAQVLSWEKALFLCLQWPWVLWGCLMALRDRLAGGFVDFRITPKGGKGTGPLPWKVMLPYVILAMGSILPVMLVDDVTGAMGFYLLALANAAIYAAIVAVMVIRHYRENRVDWHGAMAIAGAQVIIALFVVISLGISTYTRGIEGLFALSVGLEPFQLVRTEFVVAGAGLGPPGSVRLIFDPGWK